MPENKCSCTMPPAQCLPPVQHSCCPPPVKMVLIPVLPDQDSIIPDAELLPTPLIYQIGGKKYQLLPVTTANQVIMSSGSSVETDLNILKKAIDTYPAYYKRANIAERDALASSGLKPNDIVYVADAMGDPSVSKGGATYMYQADGSWQKIMEEEAMDMVEYAYTENETIPDELRIGGMLGMPVTVNAITQTHRG